MKSLWLRAALVVSIATISDRNTAKAEALSLNITPGNLGQTSQPDDASTLDLGGGFIEFLLTGRIRSEQAPQRLKSARPADTAPPAAIQVVAYHGPLSPGEIVLNVTKKKVYRILPDGLMEVYNDRTDISSLINSTMNKLDR